MAKTARSFADLVDSFSHRLHLETSADVLNMPKQIVKVESPLKGINRALAREEQPELSIFDSLNVLPFDRSKRLRIGQRPGTAALFDPITDSPVNGLYQVTLGQVEESNGGTFDIGVQLDGFALDALSSGDAVTNVTGSIANTNVKHGQSGNVGDGFDDLRVMQEKAATARTNRLRVRTQFAGTGVLGQPTTATTVDTRSRNYGLLVYEQSMDTIFGGSQTVVSMSVRFVFGNTITGTKRRVGLSLGGMQTNTQIGVGTEGVTFNYVLVEHVSGNQFRLTYVINGGGFADQDPDNNNQIDFTIGSGAPVSSDEFVLLLAYNATNYQITLQAGAADPQTIATGAGTIAVIDPDTFSAAIVEGDYSGTSNDSCQLRDVIFYDATFNEASPSLPREVKLVATSKKAVFLGDLGSVSDVSGVVLSASRPSMADYGGHVYIVDGTHTLDLDVRTPTIGDLTASAGSVPVGSRWARSWRGRLILGGADSDPQNFFAAQAGDPTNWDFSDESPGAAFAGNASTAGKVGDVLLDGIPFTNDTFLLMGDHSVWAINGDPTDGGSIDLISGAIGILGRDAWTIAPDGTLYFTGTGGLYKLAPGSTVVEPLSVRNYPQFFQGINRKTSYFGMQYDRDLHGLYVFVSSITTGTSTHLWYDVRTESLWPQQFPDAQGPMASLIFDGDKPSDRLLLLGGRDGTIRYMTTTNRTDDGTAITSYATLGPFHPTDGASVLTATTIDFGELASDDSDNPERWGVNVVLQAGPDAYSVTEGTPHSTATIACSLDRRQKTMRQRLRGGWFTMKLANATSDTYFAFETAILEFEPAGRLRERR